jgi:hypothetical protein
MTSRDRPDWANSGLLDGVLDEMFAVSNTLYLDVNQYFAARADMCMRYRGVVERELLQAPSVDEALRFLATEKLLADDVMEEYSWPDEPQLLNYRLHFEGDIDLVAEELGAVKVWVGHWFENPESDREPRTGLYLARDLETLVDDAMSWFKAVNGFEEILHAPRPIAELEPEFNHRYTSNDPLVRLGLFPWIGSPGWWRIELRYV